MDTVSRESLVGTREAPNPCINIGSALLVEGKRIVKCCYTGNWWVVYVVFGVYMEG